MNEENNIENEFLNIEIIVSEPDEINKQAEIEII